MNIVPESIVTQFSWMLWATALQVVSHSDPRSRVGTISNWHHHCTHGHLCLYLHAYFLSKQNLLGLPPGTTCKFYIQLCIIPISPTGEWNLSNQERHRKRNECWGECTYPLTLLTTKEPCQTCEILFTKALQFLCRSLEKLSPRASMSRTWDQLLLYVPLPSTQD